MSRILASAASLIALAAAVPATAQTVWTSAPTAADMAAVYPAKAKAEGIGGGVELVCAAARDGGLTACDVLGETPRGYGFGSAARKLAQSIKVAGVAKDAEVRLPITFSPDLAKGGVATVKTPQWTAIPSLTDMQSIVPKTEGGPNNVRVTLVCDVLPGGSLGGCAVDREEPAGQGFGPAVLGLAPKFQVALMSAEGMPTVGSKVRVPVRFDLKPVQQAAK